MSGMLYLTTILPNLRILSSLLSLDRSYGEDTEQQELFEYVGLEVLEHSFNGFNTVS